MTAYGCEKRKISGKATRTPRVDEFAVRPAFTLQSDGAWEVAMRKLVVNEQLSLDGVMQAPGDADEDRSGGFAHGGWFLPYFDDDLFALVGPAMPETDAYLFGRRTYEIMARYWPHAPADNPFTDTLNRTAKYVASTTLEEPLAWRNSTLLAGPVPEAVTALKREPGGTIAVLGSGQLVRTLLEHGLVDEYALMIAPVLLGGGRRLFDHEGRRHGLRLVQATTTSSGVIHATYAPEEDDRSGGVGSSGRRAHRGDVRPCR